MSKNKKKGLEKIEEASNKEAAVTRVAMQVASHLLNEENLDRKINLAAALSVLAIAAGSQDLEGMRLLNVARRLLKT